MGWDYSNIFKVFLEHLENNWSLKHKIKRNQSAIRHNRYWNSGYSAALK